MWQVRICCRSRNLLTSVGCTPISSQHANVHIIRRRPEMVVTFWVRHAEIRAKPRDSEPTEVGRCQDCGRQSILLTIEKGHLFRLG
jgi:hypothetical protein